METQAPSPKTYGFISWLSLIIGVTSFFLVFVTPTRVANTGSAIGDSITLSLMVMGVLISIFGLLKKTEKKALSVIGLLLSLSFIFFWIMIIVLMVTGQIPFAP
ncbi:hypothetical protein NDQ57_00760 [Rossellomorea marisflavi]|uniref:hypothetical protein n=1 Tax=Rossellomorea marisflavi TaxID=189381 RepID=UPI00064F68E2|nr:hypothetical protein [Rossellomorea marisflavi]KML31266.1 hypothetical protein VL12_18145 [Rossellomorea marisflavi]MCM2603237.1 hypothetical protein [Rossellomorea marisflavi]VXC36286.1 conserved membrane hypothetical protein [Bacillus sp. 349Y]